MTRAPANLLAVRRLLLDHLNVDPDAVRGQDLEPAEVGIVGDPAHRGGYHCGSDRVVSGDYSVVESPRDRTGLTEFASALDVGDFSVTVNGKRHTLATFSMWLVAQCKAGTADSRDIREVIYSPDGQVVRRWDRLGRRSSGDSSHRWHTHISFHRDAIKAGRDQAPLFRRYLTTIGLLEDEMTEAELISAVQKALTTPLPLPGKVGDRMAAAGWARTMEPWTALARVLEVSLAGRPVADVDEQALAAELAPHLLAQLDPARIAAAIPPALARQVADELAARLQG